ncbi:protein kinase domain-containing protein [Alteromonas lipotrueiana]|uniref:protein kinase domain-containing protein n=1 Tax=Alteromonas lipotrueiana TaxID=2803815 RepID=UPI001C47E556|nr:protein kinase [Alteromonas lipotrueiana]
MTASTSALRHFYIPEEQSIYLLSHADAKKLKDWVTLCIDQLAQSGYRDIGLIGKGAFGFVFSGTADDGTRYVFKFSRITLPQHVQDRLEDEAYMLSQVYHPRVPGLVEFQRIRNQAILMMHRAKGEDLEQVSLRRGPLPARVIVKMTVQLAKLLLHLRSNTHQGLAKPIVHGDIKPSNLMWDTKQETLQLIDWGSSVFAQVDATGQFIAGNVMDLMSGDMHHTNARLGDVYFIGEDQLNGAMSSPRFDEQGLASTIYALASGQSCRFGTKVITPLALGLPKLLAEILANMLSDEPKRRHKGADYLFSHLHVLKQMVFTGETQVLYQPMIPTWVSSIHKEIETVVYSSRKSFLRQHQDIREDELQGLNDAQFERYYKNYLMGMGETEKAFIAAIGRLGKYPVVGGIAIRWEPEGIYVDSSLNLYNSSDKAAFEQSVNNVINLGRAIHRHGIFKCCMFNAKDTLHIERASPEAPFLPQAECIIPFEVSATAISNDTSRTHSYFEDGDDPDELLRLPEKMMALLAELNTIHHTGCIIFEALPTHLKIHSYYMLLDHSQATRFEHILAELVATVPEISGLGISGFMKLPYKDTRFFDHKAQLPERYYPRNPRAKPVTE